MKIERSAVLESPEPSQGHFGPSNPLNIDTFQWMTATKRTRIDACPFNFTPREALGACVSVEGGAKKRKATTKPTAAAALRGSRRIR